MDLGGVAFGAVCVTADERVAVGKPPVAVGVQLSRCEVGSPGETQLTSNRGARAGPARCATPACWGRLRWDPPNVIFQATDEMIQRYAVPTIEQGERTFVAISEPSGGAVPGRAINTTAKRDGEN